jgi:hypothetical protein
MRTNPRLPIPMTPLHLPANTDLAHLICRCARATPTNQEPHAPLPQAEMNSSCDASKEDTTPRRVRHTSSTDRVFTQAPNATIAWCHAMVPTTGRTTPKGHRHHHHRHRRRRLSPELAPSQSHAPSHGKSTLPLSSATYLPEGPVTARNPTSEPPASTCTTPPAYHHGGADTTSSTRKMRIVPTSSPLHPSLACSTPLAPSTPGHYDPE